MVIRTLAALSATAILFTACSQNDGSPAEDETGTPHAADTASAKIVAGGTATVDSLGLSLSPGETYRYKVTQTNETSTDSANAVQTSVHVYKKRIKARRADGTIEYGMTMEKIDIVAKVTARPSGTVVNDQKYSSSDSSQQKDERYLMFNALIGEEVTVIVTPRAVVQEISGLTPIVNKMIGSRQVDANVRAQVLKEIESTVYGAFTELEHLRFPTEKLDSTKSWKVTQSAPLMNAFVIDSDIIYAVKNVKELKGRRAADVDATLRGRITVRPLPKGAPIRISIDSSSLSGVSHTLLDVEKGYTIYKKNDIATYIRGRASSPATNQTEKIGQISRLSYTVELIP
ncbi:MAG TPA: hypothetical protein DIS79_05720 [Bacteroidetes bacterium]|nr:hypothetical protein [Bacteroidota bacterium]HRK04894.1 DUF6263 family protein [Chlorobiota bacterium]